MPAGRAWVRVRGTGKAGPVTATITHGREQTATPRVTIMNGAGSVAACFRCGDDTDQRVVLVTTTGACRASRALCLACRHPRHRDDT